MLYGGSREVTKKESALVRDWLRSTGQTTKDSTEWTSRRLGGSWWKESQMQGKERSLKRARARERDRES